MEKFLITTQIIKENKNKIIKNLYKNLDIITIYGKDLFENKELSYEFINFLNQESKKTCKDIDVKYDNDLIFSIISKNQANSYFIIAKDKNSIVGSIRCDQKSNYKNFADFLKTEKIIVEEEKIKLVEKEIDILNKNDFVIEIGGFYIDENFRGTGLSNKLIFEIINLLKEKGVKNVYLTTNPDKKTTPIFQHLIGEDNLKVLVLLDAEGFSDNIVEKGLLIKRDYSVLLITDTKRAIKNIVEVLLSSDEISKEKNESLIEKIKLIKY